MADSTATAEQGYTPAFSEQAVEQLVSDARESLGEIGVLEGAEAKAGGYIALYNRLIEFANTFAQLAQVAEHGAACTMEQGGLKEVVTPQGRALVYGGRTYITKRA